MEDYPHFEYLQQKSETLVNEVIIWNMNEIMQTAIHPVAADVAVGKMPYCRWIVQFFLSVM